MISAPITWTLHHRKIFCSAVSEDHPENCLVQSPTIISIFYLAELGWLIVLKLAVDFVLISLTARLFNQTGTLKNYVWVALLYPFITVYIALTSQLKSFEWKGRSFKK